MKPEMNYGLTLENPIDFHHELHRPMHFLGFADEGRRELEKTNTDNLNEADREDLFS